MEIGRTASTVPAADHPTLEAKWIIPVGRGIDPDKRNGNQARANDVF